MTTEPAAVRSITLPGVDADLVDEVRAALSAEVARAQRVATKAAAELVAETDKDPRSGAVAIARSLATAARLAQFSENLLGAWANADGTIPPAVADAVVDQAERTVKTPRRRRTKAEIEADVKAQAEAAALAGPGAAVDPPEPSGELGLDPDPGMTREEMIAATRAELDALNGEDDPPPPPTLAEAAAAVAAQGPTPQPVDRAADADVAEALAAVNAAE